MRQMFSNGKFIWWIGVVEDRDDPLYLGRCKVRIFGYHNSRKSLLPTEDLPWATPIQPVTSAAASGVGSSPLGPVEGTWVVGFYLDGDDMQQPVFFGTIATRAVDTAFESVPEIDDVQNFKKDTRKDSQNNTVKDEQGFDIRVGQNVVEGYRLGQTSEQFETGGKGPATINAYNGAASGDYGGASYGSYQLASYLPAKLPNGRSRPSSKNSPVKKFLQTSSFKSSFEGLEPATPEFDEVWASIGSTFTEKFDEEQHKYIEDNYYRVMLANLKRKGLDLSSFGPAVQDLIWSTAVQLGPNFTSIFLVPLKDESNLTDTDIVNLVGNYKIKNVDKFFKSSSQNIRDGVASRYTAELDALTGLIV